MIISLREVALPVAHGFGLLFAEPAMPVAAAAGAPIWVFAAHAVVTVIWRVPPPNRRG